MLIEEVNYKFIILKLFINQKCKIQQVLYNLNVISIKDSMLFAQVNFY